MAVKNVDELMICVCTVMGAYPHLDVKDIVEDVRQIARLTAQSNLGDAETEKAVVHAACILMAADHELTPMAAIKRVLRAREAVAEV